MSYQTPICHPLDYVTHCGIIKSTMSIFDRFRHHDTAQSPIQQLPGMNPSYDELMAARQANNEELDAGAQSRREIVDAAAAAGRVVIHNSEVTGEVPVVAQAPSASETAPDHTAPEQPAA